MKYSSDKPISKSSEDRYSRKEYSKKLAELLYDKNLTGDLTVGLYSKWGYGKSSVLAMVKEYIGNRAIVIAFNPWIFENQTAIVTSLLYQLASEIDKHSNDKKRSLPSRLWSKLTRNGALNTSDSVYRLMKDYTKFIGIGLSLATGSSMASAGTQATSDLVQKYLKTSSITDIKKRIERKIKLTNKRVIIIIDDIDRLDKDEVFQLLKLVKIIADFKGVTYLMAFDDEAVASAIKDRYSTSGDKESGRAFLEKIIQVPLHLPLIPPAHLNKELLSGINEILKENDIQITDEEVNNFRAVYDKNIAPLVDSPRMIARYLNSIKFIVPFTLKEVNITDLLIIEALRLFYPSEYARLRKEKQLLTETAFVLPFEDDDEMSKKVVSQIDQLCGGKANVIELTRALFPIINNAYKKQSYTEPILTELRREKRVASPDYYDRYFSYGIITDDVSDTDIITIMNQPTAVAISSKLAPLLMSKNQDLILDKVKIYYKNSDNTLEIAKAILLVANSLSKKESGIFGDSPIKKSIQIVTDIVKNTPNRLMSLNILLHGNINPEQLFYLAREVILNSEDDSRERFLEKADFNTFKNTLIEKIRTDAKKGKLHRNNSLCSHILYQYWAKYGKRQEVDTYLKNSIKTADEALDYITLHLSKWTNGWPVGGCGDYNRGNFDRATYLYIENTVDVEYLYKLIIKEYPDLKNITKYTKFEDIEGNIHKIGNEQAPEFRKALVGQIVYIHNNPPAKETSKTN